MARLLDEDGPSMAGEVLSAGVQLIVVSPVAKLAATMNMHLLVGPED